MPPQELEIIFSFVFVENRVEMNEVGMIDEIYSKLIVMLEEYFMLIEGTKSILIEELCIIEGFVSG